MSFAPVFRSNSEFTLVSRGPPQLAGSFIFEVVRLPFPLRELNVGTVQISGHRSCSRSRSGHSKGLGHSKERFGGFRLNFWRDR